MVSNELFANLHYVQQSGECLLASYGVAAYPFTREPIQNYFYHYCRKFHIRAANPVMAHLRHYIRENEKNPIPGYEFIQTLHHTQTHERSFSRCRRKFYLTLIQDVKGRMAQIDGELYSPALTSLMVHLNDQQHSLAVFGTTNGLIWFDTRPTNNGFSGPFPSLSNMQHVLGSGLLLRELYT
jgi:hypothetical protein